MTDWEFIKLNYKSGTSFIRWIDVGINFGGGTFFFIMFASIFSSIIAGIIGFFIWIFFIYALGYAGSSIFQEEFPVPIYKTKCVAGKENCKICKNGTKQLYKLKWWEKII